MSGVEPPAVAAETWHRVKYNPWSRLVAARVGGAQIEARGGRYGSCAVGGQPAGTREISWIFDRGPDRGPRRRRRVLVFRAVGGDTDRWEVVLREERAPRALLEELLVWLDRFGLSVDPPGLARAPVYHYNSLHRRCGLAELTETVQGLLADSLAYRRRPIADCGCSDATASDRPSGRAGV